MANDPVATNPIWSDPNGLDFTRASQVGTLPVRGEKRLVPVEIDMGITAGQPGVGSTPYYEAISLAKSTFTDYITVKIPNRSSQTGGPFVYRFLINPHTLSVARQTVDAHTMTRGGWQMGVWGEDTIDLHMTGITAGQYFEDGLTSLYEEFSISYRNLAELMNVFENNGYWFEGEEVNPQWNAPDYTRKRIKSQEDVQLTVGNFIWHGMFVNMTVTRVAENPFFVTFDLNFLAWKERFTTNSPWLSSIRNDVYRGHSKEVLAAQAKAAAKAADDAAAARQAQRQANMPNLTTTASDFKMNPPLTFIMGGRA